MENFSQAARRAGTEASAWTGAPKPRADFSKYRAHKCGKTHRTGAAMARCIWGTNARIEGAGVFAVVHYLRAGRMRRFADVLLYEDPNAAYAKYREMSEPFYCGGSCRNAGGRHYLIRLDLESQVGQ